jgi:hypothetical protein
MGRRALYVGLGFSLLVFSGVIVLLAKTDERVVLEDKENSAVNKWLSTLKGAESFLDDADHGRLPSKGIVPSSLTSVEHLLKKTVSRLLG